MSGYLWKQKEFILSTFNARGGSGKLRLLQEAHFNLAEFVFMNRESVLSALEECEDLALASLVQDRSFCGIGDGYVKATDEIVLEAIRCYSPYRYVEGYYIWDEPTENCFEACRDTTRLFQKHAPDKLAFSVIFPSYGVYTWKDSPFSWENNSYVHYVNRYLDTVRPVQLSMNHYVFKWNPGISSLDYCDLWRDMGYCRKCALEQNLPFWFYYQGLGDFDPPDKNFIADMTPAKIRVQMNAALAYGVKQLSSFCAEGSIFDSKGNKTILYDPVKEINAEILHVGNFLFDKTSCKLYHTGINKDYLPLYFLDDLNQDELIEKAGDHLILGRFKGQSGENYLVVVNKEFNKKITGTIALKEPMQIHKIHPASDDRTFYKTADTIHYTLPEGFCEIYELSKERNI